MLKDRPGHRGNLSQALIASINGTAFDPMMLALFATHGTVRNHARKSLLPKMLKASIIIGKLTVKIVDCVP